MTAATQLDRMIIVLIPHPLDPSQEGYLMSPHPLIAKDTPAGLEILRRKAREIATGNRLRSPFRIVRFLRAEVIEEVHALPGGEG